MQDWAGAADGKVSGVTKVMLAARARVVEIDRLGIIIVLGVSGRSDQGGRIRHEKWGTGKSFVELLVGVVIWRVKLDTCQVNSLSNHIQCSL